MAEKLSTEDKIKIMELAIRSGGSAEQMLLSYKKMVAAIIREETAGSEK